MTSIPVEGPDLMLVGEKGPEVFIPLQSGWVNPRKLDDGQNPEDGDEVST